MKYHIVLALVALTLAVLSCSGPSALLDGGPVTRQPAIEPGHPLYDRVEGVHFENECSSDGDCRLGGCSAEVCSAAERVITTCEIVAWPPTHASCGCVADRCIWYVLAEDDSAAAGQQSAALIRHDGSSSRQVEKEPGTFTGS